MTTHTSDVAHSGPRYRSGRVFAQTREKLEGTLVVIVIAIIYIIGILNKHSVCLQLESIEYLNKCIFCSLIRYSNGVPNRRMT